MVQSLISNYFLNEYQAPVLSTSTLQNVVESREAGSVHLGPEGCVSVAKWTIRVRRGPETGDLSPCVPAWESAVHFRNSTTSVKLERAAAAETAQARSQPSNVLFRCLDTKL